MPQMRSPEVLRLPASMQTEDISRSSSELARQWLLKFVALTGQEAGPVLFQLWSEHLQDIAPDLLNAACDRLMKTWRFPKLPLPGDIRAQCDQADEKGFELEAEQGWERVLAWVGENYYPDSGVRKGAPHLPAAIEHVARAAGGYSWIEKCPLDQLVWCRKTFLAAYKGIHETAQVEHLLGAGEAKRILNRLKAGFPHKQLAAVKPSGRPESSGDGIPPAEVRAALNRIAGLPTEEEWQARKARLKQSALDWATAHGLEVQKTPSLDPPQVAETASPIRAGHRVPESHDYGVPA
jgi:hypothetical protein